MMGSTMPQRCGKEVVGLRLAIAETASENWGNFLMG